jgi:PAS domain S-box-containing protein
MLELPAKILLVDSEDDDFIVVRNLISKIRGRQYRLEWIKNYGSGLAAVERGEHDICLLGYHLGGRTGLELLRASQKFSRRPPMILLTEQGDHETDVEAMKAGASEYLVKSQLNPDMLERAVRYAIAGKHAEQNLRRERDLISRIMETSPVGIVVTDDSGKITFANHCAEKILGLTKEEIDNGAANVLGWRPVEAKGGVSATKHLPLRKAIEAGQPVQDVCHELNLPDRRRLLLSVNATPIFDAVRNIDGLIVTVEDITRRLALESQLRQSQKMECVGQLAAGVAHDINNILTIIQGHAGILLGSMPPASDAARSLKQISDASERAAGFIKHLLTFSRKQVFQTKVLDLNTVLRNMVDNMLPRMLGEQITLQSRYVSGLPSVAADASMIEQIVMNLTVNSRDAMPKGGRLLIETTAVKIGDEQIRKNSEARPGEFICLTVTDTGCGMEPKVLERIFEPFFTTKAVGEGTGIGLATVYGIVKQHHGWAEVTSKVGAGTTFKIYLPAVHAVYTSGYSAELVGKDMGKGGTAFLPKPYQPQQVARLVRDVLGRAPDNDHETTVVSPGDHCLQPV